MIKAIIPTRSKEAVDKDLLAYFKEAGIVSYVVPNKTSIWEAFSEGYKYIGANDIVILCHDDIEILNHPKFFIKTLLNSLKDVKTGFIGVAGCKKLPKSAVWWENLQDPMSYTWLSGQVFHPKGEEMSLNYYGPYQEVEVLDGLFLACRGNLLQEEDLKKPSWMPDQSNWDFYDITLTYTKTRQNFINKTVPIQIYHKSIGIPRDTWNEARLAFIDRFF